MIRFSSILPRAAAVAVFAALSGVVRADPLAITSPSSTVWWVAKSQNVLSWTCANVTFPQFTVLIGNPDPTILTQPLAIIAEQDNFDCSIIITQDQSNQPANTGYFIQFANPLNNTDVYAQSQPFEIKPLGSLYPSQVTPTANASGSASQTGASGAPTTSKSAALSGRDALGVGMGLGVVGGKWGVLVGAGVVGLVGLML